VESASVLAISAWACSDDVTWPKFSALERPSVDLVEAGVDDVLLRREFGRGLLASSLRQRGELLPLHDRGLLQRGGDGGVSFCDCLVADLCHRLLDGGFDGELDAVGGGLAVGGPCGLVGGQVGLGTPDGEHVPADSGPDDQPHGGDEQCELHASHDDAGVSQGSRMRRIP
jgi:hypothetical protein